MTQLIFTLCCCYQTNFHSYIIGHYIIVAYLTGKSYVAIDSLPVGYILQYHVKLGLNQKLVPIDKSFIATDESSGAADDSSVVTEDLHYHAKLGQNQKFVQTGKSYIATNQLPNATDDTSVTTIDLHLLILMVNGLRRTIDLFGVGRMVTCESHNCGLNCQSNDLVISYMHKSFENQRILPFKISNQLRLRAYLSDATRPVLRVYVVKN
ncbi:hypothetical protein H5410_023342 [Solanum commersonii]|uniref:Uncharacterized protein n=1 Tax=Solanum commersonii TaxID=4109 RepID=A0A9J5ZI01_SOLCO|nr:hypothetical protein H5410_023342 [Solanum commersonii]